MAPPPSARPAKICGVDHVRDSRYSTVQYSTVQYSDDGDGHVVHVRLAKGMAMTIQERQLLGIHGLLPPRFARTL